MNIRKSAKEILWDLLDDAAMLQNSTSKQRCNAVYVAMKTEKEPKDIAWKAFDIIQAQ